MATITEADREREKKLDPCNNCNCYECQTARSQHFADHREAAYAEKLNELWPLVEYLATTGQAVTKEVRTLALFVYQQKHKPAELAKDGI